jgi:hypothetical protein
MQTNFRKNTGTRSRGKQWTYSALSIFELCICEYGHLNHIRCSISRAPLNFINVQHLIYIYIFTNFISIFMANIFFKSFCHVNKQCLLLHEKIRRSKAHDKKRNFLQYITKNIVTSTHCAFEGWRMFKVMKPSMW